MKKIKHKKNVVIKQRLNNRNNFLSLSKKFFLAFLLGLFLIFFLNLIKQKFFIKNINNKNKTKTVVVNKLNSSKSDLKKDLEKQIDLYYDSLMLFDWLKKPDENIILIDVRDNKSFEKGHIKNAVNYQSIDKIIEFLKDKKSKLIVVYGNYQNDIKSKEIVFNLLNRGYNTKLLSIGYNEFRHLKILWLPESLWDKIIIEDFVEQKE